MSLSSYLLETDMSVPCVRCSREIIHQGKWFKAVSHVDCPYCGKVMLWGYEMKLRLFRRYETVPLVYSIQPLRGVEGRPHSAKRSLPLPVEFRAC